MPIIGRQPPADIIVPGQQVSARHAEIRHLGGDLYQLTDLGSTNGTFVNGGQIQSATVRLSDRISLGSQPLDLRTYVQLVPKVMNAYPSTQIQPLPQQGPVPAGVPTEEKDQTATVLGILSICFGAVSFLFCPLIFGLAGVVLGIISIAIGRKKTLGIIGLSISAVGTVVGLIFGAIVAMLL